MYLCIHKSIYIYIYMYKYINIGDLPFSTWDPGSPGLKQSFVFSCRSHRGTVTVNKHRGKKKSFKQTKSTDLHIHHALKSLWREKNKNKTKTVHPENVPLSRLVCEGSPPKKEAKIVLS